MLIYETFGSKGRVLRVSLATLVAGVLMLSFSARVWAGGDTLQLAFIGPLSGKDSDAGRAMLDGVNLYVAEINRRGGVDGRNLEVLAYNDQNNKDIARERAREIARDSNALVVIGHYYSSISLEGGKIYKQYGIPAVTASATAPEVTEGNEWYFRVVPDTNFQGRFSAIYTHRILKQDTVNIVFERDAYGSALQRSFASTARNLGIRIKNVWGIKSESDDVDQVLKMITRALQRDPRPGALFVGLQDHEAAKLVRLIRDAGVDLTVVGGDALGSENFPRRFKDISLAKRNPGHYTDGIYATTFFIRDIGNFKAQQFNHAFKRRFGREPDQLAATSYDAAAIAVEAIKRAKPGGDPAQRRERIRNQLTTFSDIETAYKGVTGRIYFDEHGNAMKPFPFGVYLQSKLISAPVQLKPIVNPEAIADLHEKLEEGNILAVDDHFMYKTTVIYTGIDINGITNIDLRNVRRIKKIILPTLAIHSPAMVGSFWPLSRLTLHGNGSLAEIRFTDEGIDQYRVPGLGCLPGFSQDTLNVFFFVQDKALAAVTFGHQMIIGASQHRGHIVAQNGQLVPGYLGPPGVVTHNGNHRYMVAYKGIKFLQAESRRPVAVNQPDFGLRMGQF